MTDQAAASQQEPTRATQATYPAYIASAHHVHEATVRGGLWTARCDWSAGWSVPLIADPEAAVVFVSCPKCREMREATTDEPA